jgi:HK97 family phage portal protein
MKIFEKFLNLFKKEVTREEFFVAKGEVPSAPFWKATEGTEEILKKLYETHPLVRATVKKFALACISDGWELIPLRVGADLEEKRRLEAIFSFSLDRTTFHFLLYRTFVRLKLLGKAFWEVVRDETNEVRGFRLLLGQIKIECTEKGVLQKITQVINGKEIPFAPEEVLVFLIPSPFGNFEADMEFISLDVDIATDLAMRSYNQKFFEHGTAISGIFSVKSPMSREEFEKLKAAIMDSFYGVKAAHRAPVFFKGEIEFNKIEAERRDLEFLGGREFTLRLISAVTGVPTFRLGFEKEVSRSTAIELNSAFLKEEIVPARRLVESAINSFLKQIGINDWEFRFKEPILPDLELRAEVVDKLLLQGVITKEEARAFLGFGKFEEPLPKSPQEEVESRSWEEYP